MENAVNVNRNWGWFLLYGIALVVLGLIALSTAVLTTMISVVLLGILVLLSGIVLFVDAFRFWRHKTSGFIIHLTISLLYLVAGVLLIKSPLTGAISFTFILAVFYILVGLFRLIGVGIFKLPHSGWRIVSGLVALALGILIFINWPAASLFIIGLFVGIELLFVGWSYIILALATRV